MIARLGGEMCGKVLSLPECNTGMWFEGRVRLGARTPGPLDQVGRTGSRSRLDAPPRLAGPPGEEVDQLAAHVSAPDARQDNILACAGCGFVPAVDVGRAPASGCLHADHVGQGFVLDMD